MGGGGKRGKLLSQSGANGGKLRKSRSQGSRPLDGVYGDYFKTFFFSFYSYFFSENFFPFLCVGLLSFLYPSYDNMKFSFLPLDDLN